MKVSNPFLCFVLLSIISCSDRSTQVGLADAPPPAVTVAAVEQREISDFVEDVGRTETAARVQIRAQVSGIIKSRSFEEGSYVNAGDQLFQIDPAQFEADLAVATATLEHAKATQKKAALYLKRLRGMRAGAVAAVDLDAAISDAAVADANVQQMQAQQRLAELDLEHTRITAPISGHIGQSSIDVGNLVSASGDVLATIVQWEPIEVSWSISERIMTNLRSRAIAEGTPLTVDEHIAPRLRLSNGEEYPYSGEIFFVNNEVDPRTGTIAIRARFPNPDRQLIPGQFVTVRIQLDKRQNRLLIPQTAVQQDMQGYFVLVVKADNTVEQRQVQLGKRLGSDWIVDQGLEPGESVIYMGLEKVRPGVTVRPVKQEPAADAASAAGSSEPPNETLTGGSQP